MKTNELMIVTDAAVLAFFAPGAVISACAVWAGAWWHIFSFVACVAVSWAYSRELIKCAERILKGGDDESK